MSRQMSGLGITSWRRTNTTMQARPSSAGIHTSGDVSGIVAALEAPSRKPPKPSVDCTKDGMSNTAWDSRLPWLFTSRALAAHSTASSPTRMM